MLRTRRFGSVLPLLALFALVSTAVAPATGLAGPRLKQRTPDVRKDAKDTVNGLLPMSDLAQFATKQLPPVELNVDSASPSAQVSLITYTFGGIPAKMSFGNRFTLTPAQAPFSLQAVGGGFFQLQDGTGFESGEMIGIIVAVDAASSGMIANAEVVFTGTATIDEPGAAAFALPEPVVVKQGDIYVLFADLSEDSDSTPLPAVLPENGGVAGDPRSFFSGAAENAPFPDPANMSNYARADALPLGGGRLEGNFFVRGYGDAAPAGALFSGGGQMVNPDLDGVGNLSAVGTTQVTLAWDAPAAPEVDEVEPNNSGPSAQPIPFNTVVNGVAKSSDAGTDVADGRLEDWYSFTLDAPATVSVDIFEDGGKDFDMFLYREGNYGVSIASAAGVCGTRETFTVDLAAGTYVLGIDAFSPNEQCEATANTPYKFIVVGPGGALLTRYNIYCGTNENFEADETTFIGSVGSSTRSLVIAESAAGAFYRVAAVYGDERSVASDAVTGSPCEGGPTFAQVKVKRNGAGKITLTGAQGDLTGLVITINGVPFEKAPKVKAAKGKVNQKGPLANGQTVGQACPAGGGCVITIMTNAGCSTVTAP